MRSIGIELKIVISIVLFTLFIVGLERYQLSENIIEQFVESKKSKHDLLKNTISPIIALNLSLGLNGANEEYLDQIMEHNTDLASIELIDVNGNTLYKESKASQQAFEKYGEDMNFCTKDILDPLTEENLGSVHLNFFDDEYQKVLDKNTETTIKIFLITFVLLAVFVVYIKREFRHLKELSQNVLSYDPKKNNLVLRQSTRTDEVGVIHNAIKTMVEKISSHSKLLDEVNLSLEKKVKERTKQLEEANHKLKELTITDELTQVANRRHFTMHLKEMWKLAKRKKAVLTVVMCDIDHFKQVNDTYGHAMGDVVLKSIAKIMRDSLERNTDFIARFGGEEFAIILYDTKAKGALKLCERIQSNIRKIDGFEFKGRKTGPLSLSYGISSTIPDMGNGYEDIVLSADAALYKAKEKGRDCVVTHDLTR